MKLSEIRKDCKNRLNQVGVDDKDADYILAEVLNKSITQLFVDCEISQEEEEKINICISERISGKPVTKIFNKAYFYGLEFYINEHVLSPRPETELLVDLVLQEIKNIQNENNGNAKLKVFDLCTGSGAIACAIKKNADVEMLAVDISEKALMVAKKNAKNLNCEIEFLKSDMFKNLSGQFNLIVSNPPYIETQVCDTLDVEVKNYDPILALDGGADGLDFYRTIAENINYLENDGLLIMEIGYNQGEKVKNIFEEKNCKAEIIKDYNNLDRVVRVRKNGR